MFKLNSHFAENVLIHRTILLFRCLLRPESKPRPIPAHQTPPSSLADPLVLSTAYCLCSASKHWVKCKCKITIRKNIHLNSYILNSPHRPPVYQFILWGNIWFDIQNPGVSWLCTISNWYIFGWLRIYLFTLMMQQKILIKRTIYCLTPNFPQTINSPLDTIPYGQCNKIVHFHTILHQLSAYRDHVVSNCCIMMGALCTRWIRCNTINYKLRILFKQSVNFSLFL